MALVSFFEKLGLVRGADEIAAPPTTNAVATEGAPFGKLGEIGEKVGEHLAHLTSRLDDLQSLREDFGSLVGPVNEFMASHAQAQTRIYEMEALLAKGREDLQVLRQDLAEQRSAAAKAETDVTALSKEVRTHEQAAATREDRLRELHSLADESAAQLEFLRQQLAAENERNEDLSRLTDSQSQALHAAEQNLAIAQGHAAELAETKAAFETEMSRLQGTVEQLTPQLVQLKRQNTDLDAQLKDAQLTISNLTVKASAEREARQAMEQIRAQEATSFESERSTLLMHLEGLTSRHSTMSSLLEKSRIFAREKSDDARAADRAAKEALDAKTTAERRLVLTQEEGRQLKAQASAAEASVKEVAARSEMLNRALVAKDAQIEQAQSRAAHLAQQLESAALRFETERSRLEADNRKLIEQLQNEKAERALAQGALSIARGSREKLLTQVEAMKRTRGPGARASAEKQELADRADSPASEPASNVRPLRAADPEA